MAQRPLVEVEGLAELRRDLVALDRQAVPNALKDAGQAVAEPIANMVRGRLPRRTGELAGTVRTARIRTGAALRVGFARTPYAGPVEFGGWPRTRPYLAGGRYIFPTAQGAAGHAAARYEAELNRIIDHYGWTHP